MSTEKAIKHLFPKEAEEAAKLGAAEGHKADDGADKPVNAAAEKHDAGAKEFALRRLRESPDEELALFEDRLRRDALMAGATEQELRAAQSGQPGHG